MHQDYHQRLTEYIKHFQAMSQKGFTRETILDALIDLKDLDVGLIAKARNIVFPVCDG